MLHHVCRQCSKLRIEQHIRICTVVTTRMASTVGSTNVNPLSPAAQLAEQANLVRRLKASNENPDIIAAEVAKLLSMKAAAGPSEQKQFSLKCPKGTRDFGPRSMAIRERVMKVVVDTFKMHGAETIDTPAFELKDTLLGKYGDEGGKLVYDLDEQGGEPLSLRYDLTVPFARYVAMNRLKTIKRYQIAKVYRRDQPRMTRGRYREFYQCDFDIAGAYDVMLPEVECVKVIDEILGALKLGDYVIKINHRQLLDGMFAVCAVPAKQFKAVCSSIDKLDKASWSTVRAELIKDKHLTATIVDALEPLVCIRDINPSMTCAEAVTAFESNAVLMKDKNARTAIEQMRLLLHYCELMGVSERVRFEPSLARGLDYYTGVIFEAVIKGAALAHQVHSIAADYSGSSECVEPDADEPTDAGESQVGGVGSVAGGGRYDKLVGMFMGVGSRSGHEQDVPCVGVSLGIERLFAIMEMQQQQKSVRTTDTQVYVGSAHKKLVEERLKLARMLWAANIKTEMPYRTNPKLLDQLQYCEDRQIPFALIIGDSELQRGVVKLRTVATREERDVPVDRLVDELRTAILSIVV